MDDQQYFELNEPDIVVSARSDVATFGAMEELKALTNVMESLRVIANDDARTRVLVAAANFFKLQIGRQVIEESRGTIQSPRPSAPNPTPFSEERVVFPKEFLIDKQPKTDVERVACLAYFLTHYRHTPHFKTIDISKLNTEAAQPKLSNAAMAVDNATKTRYLVPAAKGNKQISAIGELFVQALPNRDLARLEMLKFRPKKKRKPGINRSAEPSGQE